MESSVIERAGTRRQARDEGPAGADARARRIAARAPSDLRRSAPALHAAVWSVLALLAVLLLVYIGSWVVRKPGTDWAGVDGFGVAAFELSASALCLISALVRKRARTTVLVLGLGVLSWSIGDLVLAIESAGGATPPTPSLADAFYLGFYPFSYLALALAVREQVRRLSLAGWLDGIVAGLGAAAACSTFAFQGSWDPTGGSALHVLTNFAYPLGDLLLLGIVVAASTVLPGRRKAPWLLLAAGFAINAIGDTFNLAASGIGGTAVGTAVNACAWPTAIVLIAAAVWLRPAHSSRPAEEPPARFLLPGLAASAALAILFVGALAHWPLVALGLAALTLLVAGARSGLSLAGLRALTERRHRQAVTDQLTGLGNRRALFQALDAVLSEQHDDDAETDRLAFLFVDLNHFKEVNDSFGHSVGDELLRQLGARLRGSLRECDQLVRLGGDEFAVTLPGANADYAGMVAQRLGVKLEQPFVLEAMQARISASIGIAVVPDDASSAEDLLRCADLAMYRAKQQGKCYAIYSEDLDGGGNRLRLLEELRAAIEERRLELHYQPQVDLATGEMVAVEALSRWQHPRLGYVPPIEFLPLAEEAGLMGPLTTLVLEGALAQCARWHAAGKPVAVSVNISPTNLVDPEFPSEVGRLLERFGVPAGSLVIEITETTAIADVARSSDAIERLRRLGVTVSVDDFGAGATSLAYLSSLAVTELKLDRSFITGLSTAEGERDAALVRATIQLAHAMGMRVVAEGVEDERSLSLLTDLHCDLAQGYLISRPKPAAQLRLEPFSPHEVTDAPSALAAPALETLGRPGALPAPGSATA